MVLSRRETDRFFRLWWAVLGYTNEQRHVTTDRVPVLPSEGWPRFEEAVKVRNALWAEESLLDAFIRDNPRGLAPEDLAMVADWRRYRRRGTFYVVRYLPQYAVLLEWGKPAHAYGVLGLRDSIERVIGKDLPRRIEVVLLPFGGRVIYDGMMSKGTEALGGGVRDDLEDALREATAREGIITSLLRAPAPVPAALREWNAQVLAEFRTELLAAGVERVVVEKHVASIGAFAEKYLLAQEPPRALADLRSEDAFAYVRSFADRAGAAASAKSLRRFARFLVRSTQAPGDSGSALVKISNELSHW